MIRKFLLPALFCLTGPLCLSACSSGGDAGTTVAGGGRGGAEYGFLTLSITDAPIDDATEVVVQFNGVEFMPSSDSSNQESITIMFDQPMSINLLELQGEKSKALLTNEILPTGHYNWVNLKVTAVKDGIMDSYIKFKDGTVHELDIPIGSEIGLTIIGGLEVIANTPTAKTIDFDLRKSIIANLLGDFEMKPVLNLVSNDKSGVIKGKIKLRVLTSSNCSDSDPETGNAVYLYEGKNIVPDDIDGIDPEPVASALVKMNRATGKYEYSFGFVPFGKYTATFTCEADLDDPATDDNIKFTTTKKVRIHKTGTKKIPARALMEFPLQNTLPVL